MNPLHLVTGAALLMLSAPVPSPEPHLSIEFRPLQIAFRIEGLQERFLGVVLASLSPHQVHFLHGLPPILAEPVVLGFGTGDADRGWEVTVSERLLPSGTFVYVQGLAFTDRWTATEVGDLVLDVTVPKPVRGRH